MSRSRFSPAPPITGAPGKQYREVDCVLRNTGAGWFAIDDAAHAPINVASVTNDATSITVNFTFTAKKVGSFIACPDEELIKQDIAMGPSVLTDKAVIYLARRVISAYIYYNGTDWIVPPGWSASFSAGVLTITHPTINGFASAKERAGGHRPTIDMVSNTSTTFVFYNTANAAVMTPDTNMKFHFIRVGGSAFENPNNVVSAAGNIWCRGIFEV